MATELVEWLGRVLDEHEWWAVEASRRADDGTDCSTPTGEHWHWECAHADHPVQLDPLTQGHVQCREGDWTVSLRSVEEYPTRSVGPLPHFVLPHCEEVQTPVAGHIIRHDPATVLARVAADRQIIADYTNTVDQHVRHSVPPVPRHIKLLASAYADQPGYREEWRP